MYSFVLDVLLISKIFSDLCFYCSPFHWYFFSLDESQIKYVFKDIERWNIIKLSNNIIPRSNCIGKEKTHVPQWLASGKKQLMILNDLHANTTVQCSAESREFVFKIRRRLFSHSYVFAECAYTKDDQIMIHITIPHRALDDMNLVMHRWQQELLGIEFFQFFH